MAKRVKFGDVIEIVTSKGYAYAQYTHKDSMMGALLRIFKGIYEKKPSNIEQVLNNEIQFSTFFPLQAAVNRKIVEVVANYEIRDDLIAFPIMRVRGLIDPITNKTTSWALWDGKYEKGTKNLTEEQKKLPIKGTWNDTMLISRIESGWTPEQDLNT